MTDQLLDVLKIAFLALLYLFFMRVLWVITNEVRATRAGAPTNYVPPAASVAEPPPMVAAPGPVIPAPARAGKGAKRAIARLVVVEPKARRGTSYALGHEITLGRAAGCTVSITDDAFISNLHARVFVDDHGVVVAEDLGSTNGTFLNGERLHQPRPVRKGDRLQVGTTVLEAK